MQDLLDTEPAMIPDRYIELTIALINALRQYVPNAYNDRVAIFRARSQIINEVLFESLDAEMGWGKISKDGVEICQVNGFHRNIHLQPYVQSLSSELRAFLK